MKKAFFIAIILLSRVFSASAQSSQDIQLADQYMHNGEFDKAVVLYEKLFNKAPGNSVFYQAYLTCLIELKQYDDAEKMIRKQSKKMPDDLSLYVDLGSVYQKEGNEKAAVSQYEDAINRIAPNMPQVTKLANRFYSAGRGDYAIKAYQKGRKIFNAENSDLFLVDLATLYQKNGDPQNAVNALLDIVQFNPGQKEYVQGQLQPLLENNDYAKSLQAELYRRIQKQPDNENFSDLLVWYFIQKKDFNSAFLQVKALDKRNREDGNRVFQFAQSAVGEGKL